MPYKITEVGDMLGRGEYLPWLVTVIVALHLIALFFWVLKVSQEVGSDSRKRERRNKRMSAKSD
jgi:heme exporter protein D